MLQLGTNEMLNAKAHVNYTELREMENHENIEIVAGIDFGTTYSAYAYSYAYEPDKIYINSTWPSGSQASKEATAILFDENCKFLAFGEEAIENYSYSTDEEKEKTYLFKHFKMALYQEKCNNNVNRGMFLKAANGKTMPGLKVFSAAINFLKEHLLETVEIRNGCKEITVDSVRWVLTVPAIWNDAAKQFMRESAESAGIPHENLVIALEPECASFYCQSLPAEKLAYADFKKVGAKFLVLDNGGGTVDVTVHQMLEDGRVRELYKASGGAWGGTKVDEAFVSYLCNIFTKEVIDTLKHKHANEWIGMMREFETKKRKISLNNQDSFVRMMLRPSVQECVQEVKKVDLETLVKDNAVAAQGALLMRYQLQVPHSVISEMIKSVAKSISDHTSFLMKQAGCDNLDFIIMVGGFSNSPIVVKEIKDLVGIPPVIVPENAQLAVVQGSVMFGWRPDIFKSRKSKRTYGISVSKIFREDVDPLRLMFHDDDGVKRCRMRFSKLIGINEDVDIGQTVTRNHYPVYHNQLNMGISIYESEETVVSYCDVPQARKLGSITVPMKDTTGNKSRKVNINVRFGDTEFFVTCRDVTTGTDVEAKYDFL